MFLPCDGCLIISFMIFLEGAALQFSGGQFGFGYTLSVFCGVSQASIYTFTIVRAQFLRKDMLCIN